MTPKNIKLQVSCLPTVEKEVKRAFFMGLEDYSKRFNAPISKEKFTVQVCFIELPDPFDSPNENGYSNGLTAYDDQNKRILIQVRDPFLNDWECNFYVLCEFLSVMFHEFVHAYQHICGRGRQRKTIKYNKDDPRESYFFDPVEMEARMLELPYVMLYAEKLW